MKLEEKETTAQSVTNTPAGSRRGAFYVLCAALCWSTSGVLVKLIPWNAMTITGVRSFIALIVTLFLIKDRKIRFTKTNLLGALCIFGTAFTYILANKLTTAANAIVLQYTAPVFILIISAVFLKKRFTRLDFCAVIVILLGIMMFFFDHLNAGQLLGNFVALLSGLCFAGVFLTNGIKGATPQQASLLGHLLGSVICLPFAITGVTAQVIPWISIIFMGAVQLGIAYILLAKGSALTPPLVASLISSIEPVLNPLWVLIAVGERPGLWATFGIFIVISGVISYQVLLRIKSKRQSG